MSGKQTGLRFLVLAVGLAAILTFLTGGPARAQSADPKSSSPPSPPAAPAPALAPAAPSAPQPEPDMSTMQDKGVMEKSVPSKEIDARVTRDKGGAQPIRQKED